MDILDARGAMGLCHGRGGGIQEAIWKRRGGRSNAEKAANASESPLALLHDCHSQARPSSRRPERVTARCWKQEMNVLLLTRYGRTGVTSRIRFLQYLPYLEAHGVHIHVAPFLEDDYVASLYRGKRSIKAIVAAYWRRVRQLLGARQYDLLWIEKELIPWTPAIPERLIGSYVVDYDDAVFHNYDLHASGLVRLILGNKIRTVMLRARTVVVGNDYLAEYARRAGATDIQFVPTVVDLEHYPLPENAHRDTFTIGWI